MQKNCRFFVMVLLFAFAMISCTSAPQNKTAPETDFIAYESMDSLIVYYSKENRIEWTLYADSLFRVTDENRMQLYMVKIEIIQENSPHPSVILADSARFDNENERIYAYGNIHITATQGEMFGNELFWDRRTGAITSDDWVKIIQDGSVVRGNHLRTNSTFANVRLFSVSAQGEINEKNLKQ